MLIQVNENGKLKRIDLKVAIEKNFFQDWTLGKLLIDNDTSTLNIYYKIKRREYESEPNLVLDINSGCEYLIRKPVEIKRLQEKEVKQIIDPIFVLWDYRLNTAQFNIWYKSLKSFNKKTLELKVEDICKRNVFKPRLGDFYK